MKHRNALLCTSLSNRPMLSSVWRFCSSRARPAVYRDCSSSCRTDIATQNRKRWIEESWKNTGTCIITMYPVFILVLDLKFKIHRIYDVGLQLTDRSNGCNLVRHMTIASIKVRSLKDSSAWTTNQNNQLILKI